VYRWRSSFLFLSSFVCALASSSKPLGSAPNPPASRRQCLLSVLNENSDREGFDWLRKESGVRKKAADLKFESELIVLERNLTPETYRLVISILNDAADSPISTESQRLFRALLAHGDRLLVEDAAHAAQISSSPDKRVEFVADLWSVVHAKHLTPSYEIPAINIRSYNEMRAIIPRIGGEILENRINANKQGILVWRDGTGNIYYYVVDHNRLTVGREHIIRDAVDQLEHVVGEK
jgi:hypothetical protein